MEVINDIFLTETEKFAVYVFTDTIFKPSGLNIPEVTSSMNVANIEIPVPALASEAVSDRGKFCSVVSALFTLQWAIKISREVQAALLPVFKVFVTSQ